jgi:hypothetical protein
VPHSSRGEKKCTVQQEREEKRNIHTPLPGATTHEELDLVVARFFIGLNKWKRVNIQKKIQMNSK